MLSNKVKSNPLSLPSNRNFGATFTGVLLLFIASKIYAQNFTGITWLLVACAILVSITILTPKLLHPFNVLWAKFGAILHAIVTPIIMGVLFFIVITPMGFVMRLFGWDPLRLKYLPNEPSYWLAKQNHGTRSSMRNQF